MDVHRTTEGWEGGRGPAGARTLAKLRRCAVAEELMRPDRVVVIPVGDLDVVDFVACHHLIVRDAVGHGGHDRPLHRSLLPAALSSPHGSDMILTQHGSILSLPFSMNTRDHTISPGFAMPRKSCNVFSTGWPSVFCTRLVKRPSSPAHSLTSLKCGIGSLVLGSTSMDGFACSFPIPVED